MAGYVCPQCGAPIDPTATECEYCGEKLSVRQAAQQLQSQQPQAVYVQQPQTVYVQQQQPVNYQGMQPPVYASEANAGWPVKSKVTAGVLALLLGGFGVHKFYLGKIGMGILYLVFCWTYIPALVSFVEGIIYLCSSDENFSRKNHVRVG
ncbi:MAG: TM2 domain-containing protein [Lachnospiraceae bacterium]|jgi:DNA-directed RNA polymerase subunit RPC12/RpoP|nr:TM2 domain-containing protein [Lachnospiraceae bacterium]MCI9682896.1 TM2 domain-containing protein [Lachnospiraceae bacterium]